MIATLRGYLTMITSEHSAVIEVSGVGYEVSMTSRGLRKLSKDTEILLHVHHHIREDAQHLYGFLTQTERTTFRDLLSTHGVGPALALAILDTHEPSALIDIVASGDHAALTLVPGVGKKTAERLLIELRSRLSLPTIDTDDGTRTRSAIAEIRAALENLGYAPSEVVAATSELPHDVTAADGLRQALASLGAARA